MITVMYFCSQTIGAFGTAYQKEQRAERLPLFTTGLRQVGGGIEPRYVSNIEIESCVGLGWSC